MAHFIPTKENAMAQKIKMLFFKAIKEDGNANT
jgi:hypothetical protein